MNNYKVINEQFRKINEWMDGWMDGWMTYE